MTLRLNCSEQLPEEQEEQLAAVVKTSPKGLVLEGIANTAPLVLTTPFYPLGREPRLFDSFYLGCNEAFSKPGATITISVETGESFSGPIVSVAQSATASTIAGIGGDRRLHIIRIDNDPKVTAAGIPAFDLPIQPRDVNGREVSLTPKLRPGAAALDGKVYLTVAADKEVWCWTSAPAEGTEPWRSLGSPNAGSDVTDTVVVRAANGVVMVYAIAGGALYRRDAINDSAWASVENFVQKSDAASVPLPTKDFSFERLAAIVRAGDPPGSLWESDGLAVVTKNGALLISDATNSKWTIARSGKTSIDTYPLVVASDGMPKVAYMSEARKVNAGEKNEFEEDWVIALDVTDPLHPDEKDPQLRLIGRSFAVDPQSAQMPTALFFGKSANGAIKPCLWQPFGDEFLIQGPARPDGSDPIGAPVRHVDRYVIPGPAGTIALAVIASGEDFPGTTAKAAIVVDRASGFAAEQFLLIDFTPDNQQSRTMLAPESIADLDDGGTAFIFGDAVSPANYPRNVDIYRGKHGDRDATWDKDTNGLKLSAGDAYAAVGTLLYIKWGDNQRVMKIASLTQDAATGVKTVTFERALPQSANGLVTYRNVTAAERHSAKKRVGLVLPRPGTFPPPLSQILIKVDNTEPHKLAYVLPGGRMIITTAASGAAPGDVVVARILVAFGGQTTYSPARPRNPELSWEYWNGQSWWQINGVKDATEHLVDSTGHLVSSGDIVFKAPVDLKESDVVGRTNHWIRARLIGGDYGQEKVTLTTTGPLDGSHTQTVTRDASGVRAPYVVNISVSYKLCTPLSPDLVLTQDNGGYRDQTDVNTQPNAQVQLFTPLKNALPKTGVRLVKGGAAASGCDCRGAAADGPVATSDDHEAELDRAIYLGFDAPLKGGSITLLVLVEDGAFDGAFPLVVEAFVDGVFAPVPVKDGTRGLSETGILTLSLPEELREARYFGQTLHWLRLKPKFGFEGTWQPRIRAVYLNAAFADAVETQKQEVLGSSDGSPGQKVSVARPPVVEGSLELRVREPLGDEEIDELLKADPDSVLTAVGPWQGAWVRWTQDTLAAANATARVFELAAADGKVTFGNGKHGRIPPIGRDNIVAVTYERGGGDAGNQVAAWGQINLITPIGGVDTTIAPEGAAGGSSPQGAETALRFAPANLRMRDRALTIGDIEQLALQSSPDIAQVKALRTDAGVRVVQVMRGRLPSPTNAARRELRRYLIERMPPFLSTAGALVVETPAIVAGSIALKITVADLAEGGSVADEAIKRVVALLDPATGGIDGLGWRLGASPDESDITAQLMANKRLPGIKGLVDVQSAIVTHAAKGARPLKPSELFVVRDDDVSVTTVVDEEVGA
ncbi:hypothetical protein [Mesorhizobium sp. M0590]|uniref:hypothetical protein n=1 Tax=Mesorhizobium sp. M0590 TaxID=2956966 RepID=UPI00333B63D0